MSESITKPKWRIVAICGALLAGYLAQSELLAQRTTDGTEPEVHGVGEGDESAAQRATDATDRAAAEAFVNEYRDYLETQPCLTVIPRTGDPEIDQACRESYFEMLRTRRHRIMEEIEQKLREKQKVWQGTTAELSLRPEVTNEERESAAPFLELFEQDRPAPEVRRKHFAAFFKPDSPDRCVGWRLFLRSAEEVDDGWLVDVEAGVNLLGPKFAISFGRTNEIWHVSREGELTFVKGAPGGEEPARVNARP
jgi:hypothetical protein